MRNIGIYKDWIIYQAKDGICELWKNRGKTGVHRIVTTATNYAEAIEWIDGMGKKGRKKVEQKKNSRSIDLTEYDKNQTKIE